LHQANNPQTRESKLRIVERFIDIHHHVGTIQEPGSEYLRGEMEMRWGYLGAHAVCFQGSDGMNNVCLVGSSHHVIGEQRLADKTGAVGTSNLPAIVGLSGLTVLGGYAAIRIGLRRFREMASRFPKQRLEFLAVMLETDSKQFDGKGKTSLATPVYVALAPVKQAMPP